MIRDRSCRNISIVHLTHSSKKIKILAILHQNLHFNYQSESMLRGIFNLDFYKNIKSISWEWLNPYFVIRSLCHGTYGRKQRVLVYRCLDLPKGSMALLHLLGLNDLSGPSHLFCYMPARLKICSVLRCLCLVSKFWVQNLFSCICPKSTLRCETCLLQGWLSKSAAL